LRRSTTVSYDTGGHVVRAEQSIVVERPIEEVFAYLTDLDRVPDWQSNVLFLQLQSGSMRTGAKLVELRKFLGRKVESVVEVSAYEPPYRYTITVQSGPIPFAISNVLSDTAEGTRIDAVVEGEPGRFFGLVEWRVVKAVERELWNSLATLKDILESRADPAS
jgi:carbon monoxide dehydrogenase subunit G